MQATHTRPHPAAILLVLVVAAALRLPDLALKPLHHDEAVNGWLTLKLLWWGEYRYNPTHYHGPLLYYVNALSLGLFGTSEFALRLPTALAGVLTPLALLPAVRFLGPTGWFAASLLLATSPVSVYFARTCIHETWLVLFSALWAATLTRFAAEPSRNHAMAAAAAATGCFAVKETAILTMGALGFGALLAWAVGRPDGETDLFGGRSRAEALRAWTGRPLWLAGVAVFVVGTIVLFSTFFTEWRGALAMPLGFFPWLEHGTEGQGHDKPWTTFFGWMVHSQGAAGLVVMLALIAALVQRERAGLALAGWFVSALAVYSAIPYKTPWCVLQLDLPAFLLVGWGLDRMASRAPRASVLAACGLGVSLAATTVERWDRYDDPELPYIYVQTDRTLLHMVRDHLGVSRHLQGDGHGAPVLAAGTKYPLRWYLLTRGWRPDRLQLKTKDHVTTEIADGTLVSAIGPAKKHVARLLKERGWHTETYKLRPGWMAQAWYPPEAWAAWQAEGGREANPWPVPPVVGPPPPKPAPAPAAPEEDGPEP
jgi:uncharacterized protein (TIGR03663 family)